jgi:hypothetical protein
MNAPAAPSGLRDRIRLVLTSLLILFAGLASPLAAGQVDLYSAEAPVSGESSEQRAEAMRSAFRQVLVKLTGSLEAADRADLAPLVERAVDLVQEFRYRLAPGADADSAPQRLLWVRFDAAAVEQQLAQAQVPFWPGPRPRVLVWLAVTEDARGDLSNLEGRPEAQAALARRAEERGIDLQLPLLDLEDRTRLAAADLVQDEESGIRAASQRYGATVVLVGRLRPGARERWQADWSLLEGDARHGFRSAAGPLPAVLANGLDQTVDRLVAGRVLSGGETAAPVRLQVVGIRDLADYAALIELVGRHESIRRLAMQRADGDTLTIDVWLRGLQAGLEEALRYDGRLSPATEYQPPPTYDSAGNPVLLEREADLVYRWSP